MPGAGARRGAPGRRLPQRPARHGAGAAGRQRPVRDGHTGLCLPGLVLHQQRLLGAVRGLEFEFRAARLLPHRRHLGRPRRLAAAVDRDAGAVDLRRELLQPPAARRHRGARAGGDGPDQRGLPVLHAADLQSLRPAAAGGRRRARPQSAAAGFRHDHPPADAVHGLCGLLGGVRLRHRRADERPARRRLGALVAALDAGGVDVPHAGHLHGQLLGLL
jgi:hypothetical protein